MSRGLNIATGGTDNHIVLLDLRNKGLTGSKVDYVLEHVNISANKNTVPGDISALNPSGVRFGTCALTSRGMTEAHMEIVAEFVERCVRISVDTQAKTGKQLKDFKAAILQSPEVAALRAEVAAFARTFFLPGVDVASMRYTAQGGH
jgi:glycine hydroxymethyltransferase